MTGMEIEPSASRIWPAGPDGVVVVGVVGVVVVVPVVVVPGCGFACFLTGPRRTSFGSARYDEYHVSW